MIVMTRKAVKGVLEIMYKAHLVGIVGLGLALAVVGGAAIHAEGIGFISPSVRPILINGDFEAGDTSGWTGYGCRFEVITDDVCQGKYACRAWLDQEWGGGHRATFRAPKGKYHVSMRIKTGPGTANQCWAGADKFGGAKVDISIKETGRWAEVAFDIKMREATCELYTWGPKIQGGWILLDNVVVAAVP